MPIFLYVKLLEFKVFNIKRGTLSLRGHLPLTPGSRLSWLGFSEEGRLSYFDSKVNTFWLYKFDNMTIKCI